MIQEEKFLNEPTNSEKMKTSANHKLEKTQLT